MMYQDGARKAEAAPLQEALAGALAIELPKEDFQLVTEQEKSDIEEKMDIIGNVYIGIGNYKCSSQIWDINQNLGHLHLFRF